MLWLGSDSFEPYNSFGNGAAMRVSPVGLIAQTLEECLQLAHQVTAVTHSHPEGLKGAAATASAIHMARAGFSKSAIRRYVEKSCGYDLSRRVDDIRPGYRFNERRATRLTLCV